MIRARRLMLLLTLAVLAMSTAVATPAHAAKRKVPFGFVGAVMPPELSYANAVPDRVLDAQAARMARSGVESIRITLDWGDLEPVLGRYDFSNIDRLTRAAAAHGLDILLNVTATPRWASSQPDNDNFWRYPPRDPATMAALWGQLVARYGPKGTFWAANRSVPKKPIRHWQVWNEQSAPWHWTTRPYAPGYTKLLKASYKAIKARDRRATVVAGSVVASPAYSQWDAVRDLYRAGAKRWFDEISVHPFTNNKQSVDGTIDQVLDIVGRVRKQTRKHHDGRVPILLTEVTWPASVGKVPKAALLGLETNAKGQIKRLRAGFKRLAKVRRSMGIRQAYWYTWSSPYDRKGALSIMTFRYAGLMRQRGTVFSPLPILRTFTQVARGLEGCGKSANARRCR